MHDGTDDAILCWAGMEGTTLRTAATALLVSMGMPVAAQMDPVMLGQGQTLDAAIRAVKDAPTLVDPLVTVTRGTTIAEALRRAGRAATRDALRRAVRDLPPLPGLLPAKDCGPPAEEPRGLQLLASGADGVRPVRAFACAPD